MSQPSAPCRTLAIALLVTISASAPSVARWTPAGVQSATLLEVRNDRWDDLTVYLEREGSLFKLGTVRGLSTRVLEVPAAYLHNGGGVRLKAMRPGSVLKAVSVPFNLAQGQRAEWIVARTTGPTGVVVR